jgi:hypothetical protein
MAAAWADADESDDAVAAMNRVPKYVIGSSSTVTAWPSSHRLTGDLVGGVEVADAVRGSNHQPWTSSGQPMT